VKLSKFYRCTFVVVRLCEKEIRGTEYLQTAVACEIYKIKILKSGSSNLLEPSGPVKAGNGMFLPLLFNIAC
jgi:hypothetical protein